MADRTTPKIISTRPNSGRDAFIITDSVRLAPGSLVQLQAGFANHWDDSAQNDVFLGIAISGDNRGNAATDDANTWLGDTSGAPNPDPEVGVDTSGVILTKLDTIDGTPTQAKVGALVYCPDSDTDNIDMQASGNTNAIGVLWRFRSATDCDVKLFTPMEWIAHTYESPGS